MDDITMILLALGMVAVFMGPFFVISAIKDRKEAQQKQSQMQQEIESKMKVVDGLLKVAGHTIKYPINVLSNAIPNYISYDDERSNFIDIFSSENYDNGILCEIRLLSIDDSEGKMYEYYK